MGEHPAIQKVREALVETKLDAAAILRELILSCGMEADDLGSSAFIPYEAALKIVIAARTPF